MIIAMVFSAGLPAQQDTDFKQEGIASWYGSNFDGKLTASGEPFNSQNLTAAHPTLPFGTILRITNKHNNRQTIVRVNDRGPFVSARIIDVSKAAGEALDMINTGTAPVLVEAVNSEQVDRLKGILDPALPPAPGASAVSPAPAAPEPAATAPASPPAPQAVAAGKTPQAAAPPAPAAPPPVPAPQTAGTAAQAPTAAAATAAPTAQVPQSAPPAASPAGASGGAARPPVAAVPLAYPPAVLVGSAPIAGTGKTYRLQVGAYRVPRYAVEAFDRLKEAGLNPAYEKTGDVYRVVLAGVAPEAVNEIARKLGAAGFREALVREER
ncbi:MAG: septal ring lytic transglycosylase RlpA family protein [Treponematales bacterium]